MNVVAVSQRLIENDSYAETRECLDVRWGTTLSKLGLLPLVLPTELDPALYLDRFAPAGVLLTGGNDLYSIAPGPLSDKRDAFERRLVDLALARGIAVVGVCRGMQLLGQHFGARNEKVEGHTAGATHAIAVEATTRAGRHLDGLTYVRSYHNYALRAVPEGFRVVARAEDGVVEAMEHETLPIYCQMWHPEREEKLTDGELRALRVPFAKEGDV